jgi:hypothetical protein
MYLIAVFDGDQFLLIQSVRPTGSLLPIASTNSRSFKLLKAPCLIPLPRLFRSLLEPVQEFLVEAWRYSNCHVLYLCLVSVAMQLLPVIRAVMGLFHY